jgi:hypothetical protein
MRPTSVGVTVTAVFLLIVTASASSLPARRAGAEASRTARPSDLLPKPLPCGGAGANVNSCLLTSVVGTLKVSPHIVRPGKVLTARIENFSCMDVPLSGPCPVTWERTGDRAVTESIASYLNPITPCGKTDHLCRWRVSKQAPTTRYGVIGVDFGHTEGVEGAETFSAVINGFVGILGPKPPPPLPKPGAGVPGPPSEPIVPIPPP